MPHSQDQPPNNSTPSFIPTLSANDINSIVSQTINSLHNEIPNFAHNNPPTTNFSNVSFYTTSTTYSSPTYSSPTSTSLPINAPQDQFPPLSRHPLTLHSSQSTSHTSFHPYARPQPPHPSSPQISSSPILQPSSFLHIPSATNSTTTPHQSLPNSPPILPTNPPQNEFITPNQKKRRFTSRYPTSLQTTTNIPTSNSFAALEDLELTEDDPVLNPPTSSPQPTPTSNSSPTTPNKPIRIPPIFLHNITNHRELIDKISAILTHNKFSTKLSGPYTLLLLHTIEDFRLIRSALTDNNIEFHTFRDPLLPTFSAVLRPVPTCYTSDEVHKALTDEGFPIISTMRLTDRDKTPWPLIAVNVTDNAKGRELFNLTSLFSATIYVEPRRRNPGPIQCKNCRRFGHVRSNCGLKQACPNCGGQHPSQDCPAETPKCTNCSGPHPSTSQDCPTYLRLLHKNHHPPPPTSTILPTLTPNSPPHPTSISHFPHLPSQPTSHPSHYPTSHPSHYPTSPSSHYPTSSLSHYPTSPPSYHPTSPLHRSYASTLKQNPIRSQPPSSDTQLLQNQIRSILINILPPILTSILQNILPLISSTYGFTQSY